MCAKIVKLRLNLLKLFRENCSFFQTWCRYELEIFLNFFCTLWFVTFDYKMNFCVRINSTCDICGVSWELDARIQYFASVWSSTEDLMRCRNVACVYGIVFCPILYMLCWNCSLFGASCIEASSSMADYYAVTLIRFITGLAHLSVPNMLLTQEDKNA